MILKKNQFFPPTNEGLGICGVYIPTRDAFHVGLFSHWSSNGNLYEKIIDFLATDTIRVENITDAGLDEYYFNYLNDFPLKVIGSLLALAPLIKDNKLNNLRLNIEGVVYDGAKFDVTNGRFLAATDPESRINCAIFVIALLETYDYPLLDWLNWPEIPAGSRAGYLDDWLDAMNIQGAERDNYYKLNKAIRGKHVLAASLTARPGIHATLDELSQRLIDYINRGITTGEVPEPILTINEESNESSVKNEVEDSGIEIVDAPNLNDTSTNARDSN